MEHLQRVSTRERLPFGAPGSVPLLDLLMPIDETSFPELALSFLDFSPWITLGTFSITLIEWKLNQFLISVVFMQTI